MATPTTLLTSHANLLTKAAIDEESAIAWGVRSVVRPEELPEELAQSGAARGTPGILYPLRRTDGSVVWQMRCDEPVTYDDGSEHKYFQQAGVGAIINVPEMMAARVGVAPRVLIVEGTKQTIAACLYAPEDTLVIGVQGSSNWSSDGAVVEDLVALVKPEAVGDVQILFDADVAKNQSVFDSATRLRDAIEVTAGKTATFVRLGSAGVGQKAGLDDYLGSQPPAERAGILERLRSKATAKLGARPAAKKVAKALAATSVLEVDMERGQILERISVNENSAGVGDTRTVVRLNAAAVIERAEETIDTTSAGRRGEVAVHLTVRVAVHLPDDSVQVARIVIPAGKLANISYWLDRLPGGIGLHVERPGKLSEAAEIENAIRSYSSSIELVSVVNRFGWYPDLAPSLDGQPHHEWRWLAPNGGVGRHDISDRVQGRPPAEDYQAVHVPDLDGWTIAAKRDAVRSFVMVRDLVAPGHKVLWDAAMAAFGLAFLPVTPLAAIGYFGPKSSGKSTLAQALTSALNPNWKPRGTPMATFEGSPTAMDLMAAGMSSCLLHVDDFKPESSRTERERMFKSLDTLLRRAHGSGGRRRGMIDKETGAIGVRATDNATPLVIVTGEEVPTGGDFADSGLDRMLILPVRPQSTFLAVDGDGGTGNLNRLYALASGPKFPAALRLYLGFLAQEIHDETQREDVTVPVTEAGALEAYTERLNAQVQGAVQDLSPILAKSSSVSDRAKTSVASLVVGLNTFMRFAERLGAVTPVEAEEILASATANLATQVVSNTETIMGGNASAQEVVLAGLRAAVASGAVVLGDGELSTRPVLGTVGTVRPRGGDATEVVWILPQVAASALGYPGGKRGIASALADVVVPDSSRPSEPTRTTTINGVKTRALAVLREAWDGEGDDDGSPASTGDAGW